VCACGYQLPPQEFSADAPLQLGVAHLLETAWLCLCDGTAISTLEGLTTVTDAVGVRMGARCFVPTPTPPQNAVVPTRHWVCACVRVCAPAWVSLLVR
jgi:hypothetical protein